MRRDAKRIYWIVFDSWISWIVQQQRKLHMDFPHTC